MPVAAVVAVLIASVAAMPGNVMPVLSGLVADHHGLDEAQIGYFVASGTFAGLVASASAPYWIGRVDLRWLLGGCLAFYGAALFALPRADGLGELFALQFCLGGAAIVIASGCITVLARQRNPARVLSLKISSDVVVASAFLYLLPVRTLGLEGFLLALSTCFAIAVALAHRLPVHAGLHAPRSTTDAPATRAPMVAWFALATMVVFNIAGVGVWVFLGRLAQHAGLDEGTGANVIAAGLFVGIAGALGAATLAGRSTRVWPQLCAGAIFVASIPALALGHGLARFAAAVFVFNVAWNFFVPFVMGLLATRDDTGRLASLLPGTNMLGGVLGPPLAGTLMRETSYESAMFAMTVIAACSVAAYGLLTRSR